jgi:hypothetical protein
MKNKRTYGPITSSESGLHLILKVYKSSTVLSIAQEYEVEVFIPNDKHCILMFLPRRGIADNIQNYTGSF